MFLLLIFPLIDQIETFDAILKLVSLRFMYSTCLLLSNGQFYIHKTPNIWIKNYKKVKLWTPHVPFLVHLNVQSPQCSSRWFNNFGNIVIECYKLPPLCWRLSPLCCKDYFISMSNKFRVLSTRLCIQPLLLGRLLGCQKLIDWRYFWFPSFLLLCWYLMKR